MFKVAYINILTLYHIHLVGFTYFCFGCPIWEGGKGVNNPIGVRVSAINATKLPYSEGDFYYYYITL